MMIYVSLLLPFIIAAVVHFVADFIFQTDWQAKNKSSSLEALARHVFIYSLCFYICFGFQFFLITFALHFLIDYNTSRISKRLWEAQDSHMFFVVVGFDQLLHLLQLWLTLAYIMGQMLMQTAPAIGYAPSLFRV